MMQIVNKFNFFLIMLKFSTGASSEDIDEKFANIKPDISNEIMILPESQKLLSVNDSFMVTCIGKDIKWKFVNGTTVDSMNSNERIHVSDKSSPDSLKQELRLFFKRVLETDHGDWTCQDNFTERFFTLNVYVPLEIVAIDKNVEVKEFESATLICEAAGKPKPEINWSVNGSRISDNSTETSRFTQIQQGLFIRNVTRSESGEYECRATQISQKISNIQQQSIFLDVLFEPELGSMRKKHVNGIYNSSTGVWKHYAHYNTSIVLTCNINGNPKPKIKWFHYGKDLKHYHSVLTLHLKRNKTFGEYKCNTSNSLGEVAMKFDIVEADRPPAPTELKLIGRSPVALDFQVGFKEEKNITSPFEITKYRFEMINKEDYINNGEKWTDYNISDVHARNDMYYDIQQLTPNTTYLIRVASINIVGVSDFSDVQEVHTLLTMPTESSCASILMDSLVLIITIVFINI